MNIKTCFGCKSFTIECGCDYGGQTGYCEGNWHCCNPNVDFMLFPETEDRHGMAKILADLYTTANACPYFMGDVK